MNNVLGQYRDRRPARRQHPRAAGDGLLRVQLARRERRRGTARSSAPASARRTSIARSRRSTRRSARLGADGPTAAELDESRQYPDRLDSAGARDQRRHRELPADGGVLRPRPRLRRRLPDLLRAVTLDEVERRGRASSCDPRARDRGRRRARCHVTAVTIDPRGLLRRRLHADLSRSDVPRRGLRAFCARYGIEVDASRFERAVASAAPLLDAERRRRTTRDLRPLHAAHHRADGRRGAARRRVRARDLRRVGGVPALRDVRRRAGGAARAAARRPPDRPDLELAPLPDVVPDRTSSCRV